MRQGFDSIGNDVLHEDDSEPDSGPTTCDSCGATLSNWPQPSEPILCATCARVFNVDYSSPFSTCMDGDL